MSNVGLQCQNIARTAIMLCIIVIGAVQAFCIEYELYKNNFDRAVQKNDLLFKEAAINRNQYITNIAFIEFFKGDIERACEIFVMVDDYDDINNRALMALLYYCNTREFFSTIDRAADRAGLFPLYQGIYLFENGKINEASAAFRRININRLTKYEYSTFYNYQNKKVIESRDIKRIITLVIETEGIEIINKISDMGLLRELSFYGVSHRDHIINRVIAHYYDNDMVDEGLKYLEDLYSERIITRGSYNAITGSFLEKPVYVYADISLIDIKYKVPLMKGLAESLSKLSPNIVIVSDINDKVKYIIKDSPVPMNDNKYYVPVVSHDICKGPNCLVPFVLPGDKAENLLRANNELERKKTMLITDDRIAANDISRYLLNFIYKNSEIGHVSESELDNVKYMIIYGDPENVFLILNRINFHEFHSLKHIYVLNDISRYRSRLKGSRYRHIISHIPLRKRIAGMIKDRELLRIYNRYYFLGYDIGGIINMKEKRTGIYKGFYAEYSHDASNNLIQKTIEYEKVF